MFDTIKTKYRRNPAFHAILLSGFALISAVLLILGNRVTAESIELRRIEDLQFSLSQVIPKNLHDNDLWSDTHTLKSETGIDTKYYLARKDKEFVGAAFEQSTAGYSGTITLLIGVDKSGQILGVRVLSHTETPGLGDKIDVAKSDWILGFDKKSIENLPEDQFREKVRRAIDEGTAGDGRGFVLTPSASPYGRTISARTMKNYEVMVEMVGY